MTNYKAVWHHALGVVEPSTTVLLQIYCKVFKVFKFSSFQIYCKVYKEFLVLANIWQSYGQVSYR